MGGASQLLSSTFTPPVPLTLTLSPNGGEGKAPAVSEPSGRSQSTRIGPRDSLSPIGGEGQGEGETSGRELQALKN